MRDTKLDKARKHFFSIFYFFCCIHLCLLKGVVDFSPLALDSLETLANVS